MGIRVNKALGYGINDLKVGPEDPEAKYPYLIPKDPRIDYDAYVAWCKQERSEATFLAWLESEEGAGKVLALAAYEGWAMGRERSEKLNENTEIALLRMNLRDENRKKRASYSTPSHGFRWTSDGGQPTAAHFRCIEYPDWHRHDDPIDYVEETTEGRATRIEGSTGFFPFDGFMRRCRQPSEEVARALSDNTKLLRAYAPKRDREQDGADLTFFFGGEYNQLIGRWSAKLPPLIKDEAILKHLREDWRPRVPLSILALMEFMGCFPDPESPDSMLNSLRPMVHVYWG